MRIATITHAPRGARNGNRITALRWAAYLRQLGHQVTIGSTLPDDPIDVMIALHGYHSHATIVECKKRWPNASILVAITGTDLYVDLADDHGRAPVVLESFATADRILGLHQGVKEALPPDLHEKTRVILQSASPPPETPPARDDVFEVVSVGHLRPVKDPLLAAEAAGLLPAPSRILVTQIGAGLDGDLATEVRAAATNDHRYRWVGAMTRREALGQIAAARALVITSRAEGGSNVLTEAVVCGTPVLSTRIAAAEHLLGPDYPGLFPVGDARSLAGLLGRLEEDRSFREALTGRCERAAVQFEPARERATWAKILADLNR